ncbi:hypothetical protein C0Q70_12641 [Pomacea canaliculata]|uniref:Reverse transcriptase domain-containing protein n=1 Tax=Pomacea canaliculata TaxID=400727 RepID=A0A2T7P243_POMCA|nr:hypothetical protein C0Q70_12641 [Pomacea canaliculata]
MFPNPSITVKGTVLKVVQEVKFLGVIFDRKLSFLPHIKSLRLSCQKALDILRVVGHVSWGADRTVLLRLYRALVRSKLDYGSIIYGSVRESYLKILDPIHHQGLRICLGAFRTTPVQSLYAEAGEPPLSLRRLKLMLSYACRLKSHPGNPAYRAVFRPQRAALYAIRTKEQKPLSLRVAPHLQAAGVDIKQIEVDTHYEMTEWYRAIHQNRQATSNGDVLPRRFGSRAPRADQAESPADSSP